MKKNSKIESAGFGLIDIMVGLALSMIVIIAVMAVMPFARQLITKGNRQVGLLIARDKLIKQFLYHPNWAATVAHTSNDTYFNCLQAHTSCAAVPKTGFLLYDKANTLLYNSTSATAGFNNNGTTCNTAAASQPTASCPIRVDFNWTVNCDTCNPSMILINVSFKYWDRQLKAPMVASAYDFQVVKNVWDLPCTLWGNVYPTGETAWGYTTTTAPCTRGANVCNNGSWGALTYPNQNCS